MKHSTGFLLFFAVILAVYALLGTYLLRRTWQATAGWETWRSPVFWLAVAIVVSYPLGRLLEHVIGGSLAEAVAIVGSWSMAFLLYGLFCAVAIDLARLVDGWTGFLPGTWRSAAAAGWVFLAVVAIAGGLTAAGAWNARHPRLAELDLRIEKNAGQRAALRAVVVTDIHLGAIIHAPRLAELVARVNALEPDIVLLAGDIVDEDVGKVMRQDMAETLRTLKAPLGAWACTGNHEYIGGKDKAVAYLSGAGIRFLEDEARLVDGSFWLVGRRDRMAAFGGERRKTLAAVLAAIPAGDTRPVIVLDHQPGDLGEAAAAGVDVQFSGHTHHGQLFPFNWITSRVFEVSWGYLRKGMTHVYVSSGYGTWGPPVRLGNRPELVLARIVFRNTR